MAELSVSALLLVSLLLALSAPARCCPSSPRSPCHAHAPADVQRAPQLPAEIQWHLLGPLPSQQELALWEALADLPNLASVTISSPDPAAVQMLNDRIAEAGECGQEAVGSGR